MRHREAGKVAQRHAGAEHRPLFVLVASLLVFATQICADDIENLISLAANAPPEAVHKCAGELAGCAWCSFLSDSFNSH
jgi:hypothetical protein